MRLNKRLLDLWPHLIDKIVLKSGEIEFSVAHAECGDLLEIWRGSRNEKSAPQLMPAQAKDLASLMSQELMRGAHRWRHHDLQGSEI